MPKLKVQNSASKNHRKRVSSMYPKRENGSEHVLAKKNQIADTIKQFIHLAHEQGHLTCDDLNDALPDSVIAPDELDEIYTSASRPPA